MMRLLLIAFLAILAVTAYNGISNLGGLTAVMGLEQPYAYYDDIVLRGVPRGPFALAQYHLDDDKNIVIDCYTDGEPAEGKYYKPYTERIAHLTRNLRNIYRIKLAIYQGCPVKDGVVNPAYNGKVVSETVFERYRIEKRDGRDTKVNAE